MRVLPKTFFTHKEAKVVGDGEPKAEKKNNDQAASEATQ